MGQKTKVSLVLSLSLVGVIGTAGGAPVQAASKRARLSEAHKPKLMVATTSPSAAPAQQQQQQQQQQQPASPAPPQQQYAPAQQYAPPPQYPPPPQYAQQPQYPPPPQYAQQPQYPPQQWDAPSQYPQLRTEPLPLGAAREMYESGQTLRRAGKGLTVTSILLIGAGLVMVSAWTVGVGGTSCSSSSYGSYYGSSSSSSCTGNLGLLYGGTAMSVIGHVFMGIGIPLWAVGSGRMSRAVKLGGPGVAPQALNLSRLQLQPLYAPSGSGLVGGMAGLSFQL